MNQDSAISVVGILAALIVIVSLWKVYVKAGQPGWGSLIPIYNVYLMCKIAGKSGWWVLLLLIPIVNLVFAVLIAIAIAKSFGKPGIFAAGLIFLPFVFYPILGFGDAQYTMPAK